MDSNELKCEFIEFLQGIGYSQQTAWHYSGVMNRLAEFMLARGLNEYSQNIGNEFLEQHESQIGLTAKNLRQSRCVIRRLNEFLSDGDYAYRRPMKEHTFPSCFAEEAESFLEALRRKGLNQLTVAAYRSQLSKILHSLSSLDIVNWTGITAQTIYDLYSESANKQFYSRVVRALFGRLFKSGIISSDYSGILPRRALVHKNPSVYTKDESDTILQAIDTTTKLGKRDYAVLLLALRHGIRAGDIRLLTFANIHGDTLEFVQQKTGNPKSIHLLPEVATALNEYIQLRKQDSDNPIVFLTIDNRPFSRSNVTNIAVKYFAKSQVPYNGRKHGSHSLRMTFASELVADNVPLAVVSSALGQESPDSAKFYIKFAIEDLRSCALEVPPPSGLFAGYLKCGGAVQ